MIVNSCIRNVAGRLVEIYVRDRELTDEGTAVIQTQLVRSVGAALKHDGHIVVAADVRALNVVGPKLAEYIIQVMRSDNKHLLRSGLLCDQHATFGLQLERVIRESGHAERKRFTTVLEVKAWLGAVLMPDEMTRLEQFLENGPMPE